MNIFKRMLGSGFKGLIISLALLFLAKYLKHLFNIPVIFINSYFLRLTIFIVLSSVGFIIFIWSVISLNPKLRAKTLITDGAFKYFRHPLYAAFLSFFNFGLAVFLNNWVFIIWAVLLHPIWHLIILEEEKMMKNIFPDDYEKYCTNTGRFFPKLFKKQH